MSTRSNRDLVLFVLHGVVALATFLWLVAQGLVLGSALAAGRTGGGLVAIAILMVLTALCLALLVAGAVSLWRAGPRRRPLGLAYAVVGLLTALYVFALDPRALLTTALLIYPLALLIWLARPDR